ncbi:10162_t:CDS:10 [Cetraspora pellucida]|uniref:10162_t:CDS:1 n=1 Tax=Cetraspora pellucida TaxID=1433469 RepID=A0ACA9JXQ0_9GLOM|nr:10162_t:CDS:10 [Cetraspora pellucida]
MVYTEVFCLLFFVTFIFHLIKRPRIGVNEPPLVQYRFPIIGHTYYYLYDSENFLKKCREKYGEPFSLYVFGSVRTFTGVENSVEVLKNDSFDFHAAINKDVFNQFKKLDPVYTSRVIREQISGKLDVYISRIQSELLFGIEKYFGDCKEPKTFRNIQHMLGLIVAKTVANVIIGEEVAQFEDIITSFAMVERGLTKMRFIPPILTFISLSLNAKFLTLPLKFGWNPISRHRDIFVKRYKPIVEERIRQRKKLGEKYIQKEDLLDFFLNEPHYKTDIVDDKYMDGLFAQLYAIVFASTSSTSKALAFALFDYGGRPELWNEIYEEQLKIYNDSNGNLSVEDVHKMVKLDCFLRESFRHSSNIAGLMHLFTGDSFTFSNGTTIPKDRLVFVYTRDTAFSDKFYGETANDFQPKRHITSRYNGKIVHTPAAKVDRSLLTFGVGKRACPGRLFAVNGIKLCLHKLILKYNIRTESGKVDPPRRFSALTLPPISGLVFENRN